MTIIEMAREMGKLIQESDEYKALMEARTASDNDEELQKQIGEFNLVRMKMEIESSKPEPDQDKVNELNEQLMSIYTAVMESENMVAFNKAKDVRRLPLTLHTPPQIDTDEKTCPDDQAYLLFAGADLLRCGKHHSSKILSFY